MNRKYIVAGALAAVVITSLGVVGVSSAAAESNSGESETAKSTVKTDSKSFPETMDSHQEIQYLKGWTRLSAYLDSMHLTSEQRSSYLAEYREDNSINVSEIVLKAREQSNANKVEDDKRLVAASKAVENAEGVKTWEATDQAAEAIKAVIYNDTAELTHRNELTRASIKAEEERIAAEKAEAERQAEAKRIAEEKAAQEAQAAASAAATAKANGTPYFGPDGLLVMQASGRAQQVINLLLGIPGHSNGAGYHASTGLDGLINTLSVEEATYVIYRIEGAGFGQTGAGWAGVDSTASHQAFLNQQVNGRFGGSVQALLRAWGTFSYGGY